MSIINLFSPTWDACDSYGRLASELASGFEACGYHVNQFGDDAPENQSVRPAFGGLFLGYPTLFSEFYEAKYGAFASMGPRVAITMFESTRLPDGWAENLNRCDAVVVPAHFLVDVFREAGVGTPVEVVPLGISNAFTNVTRRAVPENGEPFTFLCIGDRGLRKGWHKVSMAFVRAFGNDMAYRLIIKRRSPMQFTNPNFEAIPDDYSDAEMADLYRRAHVMVFPSAGEGFGLPPREFAATGGVVLATNWGGTADNLSQWGISLPYTLVDAWEDKSEWFHKLGQWADVDIDVLADQMHFIADHFENYADFGVRAAGFVRSHYRWESFARRVQVLWETVKERVYAGNDHRETTAAS